MELAEIVSYTPVEYGSSLTWIVTRGRIRAGSIAGSVNCVTGYWRIKHNHKNLQAHRVVWYLHHQEWPSHEIDHINGNKNDNRIENLRIATRSQNLRNQSTPKKNKSGHKNVSFDPAKNKWLVRLSVNGKNKSIGRFAEISDAINAAIAARNKYHGSFARHI
jgi:HNH endonuclease/AP2 domain